MGMPTPEGADAAMPNLPEAMAGINPRKSIQLKKCPKTTKIFRGNASWYGNGSANDARESRGSWANETNDGRNDGRSKTKQQIGNIIFICS